MVAFSPDQWSSTRQENTTIVMDFPLTLTRPSSGGNNVVLYSDKGDTKDIHENFVIVFGITFFIAIIFALVCYFLSCVLCKVFSYQGKSKTPAPPCPCPYPFSPGHSCPYQVQEEVKEPVIKPSISQERRRQYSQTRGTKRVSEEDGNRIEKIEDFKKHVGSHVYNQGWKDPAGQHQETHLRPGHVQGQDKLWLQVWDQSTQAV